MTKEQLNALGDIIKNHFDTEQEVKVLEAGCGSATHIEPQKNYKMTGIDISKLQLERNKILSEKICGDIQTYPFESQSFDMIICWYVLEHVKYPNKAMQNFIQALKPNGLIVLAMPNIWSVKGIITKLTPTIIHVWFYKYIVKRKNAGKGDIGPFPTFFKKDIFPKNIKQFAADNKLEVVHFEYTTVHFIRNMKKLNPMAHIAYKLVSGVFSVFSLGKISTKDTDYVLVLKKPVSLN